MGSHVSKERLPASHHWAAWQRPPGQGLYVGEPVAQLPDLMRRAAAQIDRCDQLTHYLSKFHTPSSTSTAASNGPSTEVTAIDGYRVSGHTKIPCQLCIVAGPSWYLPSVRAALQPRLSHAQEVQFGRPNLKA